MSDRETIVRYLNEQQLKNPAHLLKELSEELAEELFHTDEEVTVPAIIFYH